MRFVIVMLLVALWGRSAAEATFTPDSLWEAVYCHLGCPVRLPGEETRWPWSDVKKGQPISDATVPCPRWFAGVATRERPEERGDEYTLSLLASFPFRDTGFGPNRDWHSVSKADDLDRRFQPCWPGRRAWLEQRILTNSGAAEVRWLEGPLYTPDGHDRAATTDGLWLADYFWRVISIRSGDGVRTVALIVPRGVTAEDDLCPYIVTIDEVEEASGLDLFPQATDDSFEAAKGELAGAIGC